jgi:hypothetical protein
LNPAGRIRGCKPGGGRSDAERLPVFLLAMYGKSEKANLSKAEQNMMAKVV